MLHACPPPWGADGGVCRTPTDWKRAVSLKAPTPGPIGDNVVLSYFRRPRRCLVRNGVVLRTRLVEGEDTDRPLDISSLRGARETLCATTSGPFCEGVLDGFSPNPPLMDIPVDWGASTVASEDRRIPGATPQRLPPTIFYRGCLPGAPHPSRATGPLGGLRLCPTQYHNYRRTRRMFACLRWGSEPP